MAPEVESDKRRRILEITRELMSEHGADGLKIRTIARRAGVAIGSVYNIVGAVSDIQIAIFSELLDRFGETGRQAITDLESGQDAGEISVEEKLLTLSRAYMRFVDENEKLWDAMLSFNRSADPELLPPEYAEKQRALLNLVGEILADADLIKDSTKRKIAARTLWASVHGIVTMPARTMSGIDEEEAKWAQITLLVSMLVKGVRSDP